MNLQDKSTEELLEYKKILENRISKSSNMQEPMKISLNSSFGACGNQFFRYYDIRLAEAITISGRMVIIYVQNCLNKYLNELLDTKNIDYVIAGDTDSMFLNLNGVVEKLFDGDPLNKESIVLFLNEFCNSKIQEQIDKSFDDLYEYTNAYKKSLVMKREYIADVGIWTTKKRYVLNVIDKEGIRYDTPKIISKGLEVVRSSTPIYVRHHLKEALRIILQENEKSLQKYCKDFHQEFLTANIEDIAFPKSVNNIDKYVLHDGKWKKGTPINTKAALIYNYLLDKNSLNSKYEKIQEGDKIRFIYLKEQNPIGENVIGMVESLPKEFKLDKYVDYDLQFEKLFKDPIEDILNIIGWSFKPRRSLL